jgi:arginyl-tRNA synthetase
VITGDLRRAIARAVVASGLADSEAVPRAAIDPGLRPGGAPGRYASSVAFGLAASGNPPREVARLLAAHLAGEPWLARTEVSGPGFLALTVTAQALAALPERIGAAGPACARGDALAGVTLEAPRPADLLDAPGWEEARSALAAELTARLAAAAGAKVSAPRYPERTVPSPNRTLQPATGPATAASAPHPAFQPGPVAPAIAFAGEDAVRFWLARAVPGRPVRLDAAIMARHAPDNPAYAVRYAHARAASGVRWAAIPAAEAVLWRPPADQGELALLDALSWLPERVAVAARRGRPDEFARYLEELASVTIAALSSTSHPGGAGAPGSDRLALASAARAGLAAGLGLLGVSAPDRL